MVRSVKACSCCYHKMSFGVSEKIDVDADELNPHGNKKLAAMQRKLKKKADAKNRLEAKTSEKNRGEGESEEDFGKLVTWVLIKKAVLGKVKELNNSLLRLELKKIDISYSVHWQRRTAFILNHVILHKILPSS